MRKSAQKQETIGYRVLVYHTPLGAWAWRIVQGGEDLVRGAGYPNLREARAECQEMLNDHAIEAEIVVQFPVPQAPHEEPQRLRRLPEKP